MNNYSVEVNGLISNHSTDKMVDNVKHPEDYDIILTCFDDDDGVSESHYPPPECFVVEKCDVTNVHNKIQSGRPVKVSVNHLFAYGGEFTVTYPGTMYELHPSFDGDMEPTLTIRLYYLLYNGHVVMPRIIISRDNTIIETHLEDVYMMNRYDK